MIIAIDGPSSSGKSSVARKVAKILNFEHIDTGAMYRLLALKLKKENKDFSNEILEDLNIGIENNKFYLDGKDVSKEIRLNDISILASYVSKIKEVRDYMVNLQREISKNKDIVLDGRDIGTFVFPNADIKFYITASPEVRAKRRFLEDESISYDKVLEDIKKRDYQDLNRDYAPLKRADDAILIVTDDLSFEEVVSKVIGIVKEKMK